MIASINMPSYTRPMEHITHERFQEFLVLISDCFINRDFPVWKSSIVLPFSLITSREAVTLRDEDALRKNFELYLMACECMNLDQIVRVPQSLEDCEDGTWIGTYVTHLMSGGIRATRSYTSSVLLVIDEGRPKMTGILNARGTDEWVGERRVRRSET